MFRRKQHLEMVQEEEDDKRRPLGMGGVRVQINGLMLQTVPNAREYAGLNGIYQQTGDIFNEHAIYAQNDDPSIAIWWSSTEYKSAWCLGPRGKLGTDKMWAYLESKEPLLLTEVSNRPWRVWSPLDDSWVESVDVQVLNLELKSLGVSFPKRLQQREAMTGSHAHAEGPPDPAKQVELALEWDDDSSAAWTTCEYDRPTLEEIAEAKQAAKKMATEKTVEEVYMDFAGKTAEKRTLLAKTEATDRFARSKTLAIFRSEIALKKQIYQGRVRMSTDSIRQVHKAFMEHILEHMDQWVGIPNMRERLWEALRIQPLYSDSWSGLLDIKDEDIQNVLKTMRHEEEQLVDNIENEIVSVAKTFLFVACLSTLMSTMVTTGQIRQGSWEGGKSSAGKYIGAGSLVLGNAIRREQDPQVTKRVQDPISQRASIAS